ncbi:MAG: homocysteine S-methyltransferase family protein, partial [Victivallales bacterium]|nr:homocysteine S-methyltransferase family protein [Victivallales bacterium]
MTREEFQALWKTGIVLLDGATGTELAKQGLPVGVSPEAWVLEHPEAIHAVQSAYEQAGSRIVYSPTFGGNRLKLAEFDLADRVHEINAKLAKIARAGVKHAFVFGDLAPTGRFVEPYGDLPFEEAVAVYREQAEALAAGGVDGFAVETMMDLQEARAALIGIREVSALPVIVTMTYDESGHTLNGNTPASAVVALQALGADAVGCNCSAGPEQMLALVRQMAEVTRVPLVAKPNAGMPRLVGEKTVFGMEAAEFGEKTLELVRAGASIVGGCCGTTPEHIRALSRKVRGLASPFRDCGASFVSSPTQVLKVAKDEPFAVVGERLNPTGKKALQSDLRSGELQLIQKFAD